MTMETIVNIFFVLLSLSILIYLERDNLENVPFELYVLFASSGYIVSVGIIIIAETY